MKNTSVDRSATKNRVVQAEEVSGPGAQREAQEVNRVAPHEVCGLDHVADGVTSGVVEVGHSLGEEGGSPFVFYDPILSSYYLSWCSDIYSCYWPHPLSNSP